MGRGSSRRPAEKAVAYEIRGAALAIGLALAVGGCTAPRACYCRDAKAAGIGSSAADYVVACPDVLEWTVASWPDLSGRAAIGPDGTIPLGSIGRLRVEELTPAEIADKLATAVHASHADVHVAEYASRQIFLCGPVSGNERAVPYQGPERVASFLRRIGGLPETAEPRDVHVIRSNVAAGRRPEVFPVDLEAIRLHGDAKTNILLQPYDQVYVGESTRSCWAKCLPPWMHLRSSNAV